MIALITLLAAISVSVLVGRVATQAFQITGLSRQAASFQSRSALTGTDFTTRKAESVVDHPVRRRILMIRDPPFLFITLPGPASGDNTGG